MLGMPVTLEAEANNYALVRLDADVDRVSDLEELGRDLARQHGIARPLVEVRSLRPGGTRYLIVVTQSNR
jgi:hypothetical protein